MEWLPDRRWVRAQPGKPQPRQSRLPHACSRRYHQPTRAPPLSTDYLLCRDTVLIGSQHLGAIEMTGSHSHHRFAYLARAHEYLEPTAERHRDLRDGG